MPYILTSLSSIDRHVLSTEEEARLLNVISSWIQPRQISSGDKTCIPCWCKAEGIAIRSASPQLEIQPAPAEVHPVSEDNGDHITDLMCGVCGQNVSSTIPSGEHHNPEHIAQLLEHQQFSTMNKVCGARWQHVPVGLPSN